MLAFDGISKDISNWVVLYLLNSSWIFPQNYIQFNSIQFNSTVTGFFDSIPQFFPQISIFRNFLNFIHRAFINDRCICGKKVIVYLFPWSRCDKIWSQVFNLKNWRKKIAGTNNGVRAGSNSSSGWGRCQQNRCRRGVSVVRRHFVCLAIRQSAAIISIKSKLIER